MINKINIAIDGHSSCGKSTIAKVISKKYQMKYVDTGAMYRAITLYCLKNNLINKNKVNEGMLQKHISDINVEFKYNNMNKISETFLNGKNVENSIRSLEVSESVSFIARIALVRQKLVFLQQEISKNKNVVMDGRDIGTKVLPDAEIKFFITAQPEIRASRRWKELSRNGSNVTFKEVLNNIITRDNNDMSRKLNPLQIAKDAIEINNSNITLDDQNNIIFDYIDKFIEMNIEIDKYSGFFFWSSVYRNGEQELQKSNSLYCLEILFTMTKKLNVK